MNTEIELKIKITDAQQSLFMEWLERNAQMKGEVHQIEFYLNNPNLSFAFMSPEGYKDAVDFLRVRLTSRGDTVCFKHWHSDPMTGRLTHCDEYETAVQDGQAMLQLFQAIGYNEQIEINKLRKIYQYNDFEVAVDSVKNLGHFVEIEVKRPVPTVSDGLRLINEFLKSVGITTFKRMDRGYVSMLWNPTFEFGQDVILE